MQSRMAQLWTAEEEAKLVVGTPIMEKGKMRVFVDGAEIYSKGGFNAENPQPTPPEFELLVSELFPSLPATEEEKARFSVLHEEQKARGKNKH